MITWYFLSRKCRRPTEFGRILFSFRIIHSRRGFGKRYWEVWRYDLWSLTIFPCVSYLQISISLSLISQIILYINQFITQFSNLFTYKSLHWPTSQSMNFLISPTIYLPIINPPINRSVHKLINLSTNQ